MATTHTNTSGYEPVLLFSFSDFRDGNRSKLAVFSVNRRGSRYSVVSDLPPNFVLPNRFQLLKVPVSNIMISSPSSTHSRSDSSAARREAHDRVLAALRPVQFAQIWSLYHSGPSYDSLSLLFSDIHDVKGFWETLNNLPIQNLPAGHSYSWFKKGIEPTWEDRRNRKGGSWTFRVQKARSVEFWKEVLLMLVGEQFAGTLEPGDDICGVIFNSRPFNVNHISIWNRDGANKTSVDAILNVLLENLSAHLKPDGPQSYYYKKHSERQGFAEAVKEKDEEKIEKK